METKKRNGYYYINDKEYVSVTKVLGDTLAKPALYYWSSQQAARIALKDPTLNEKEVCAEVTKISRQAAERGRNVHHIVETWCKDGVLPSMGGEYNGYIQAFLGWHESVKPKAIHSEVELWSDTWGYAGRCDLVAEIGDALYVIDFKTGKGLYREVGLQLAAYRWALGESQRIATNKMGAVLLKEDGEWEMKETKDSIDNFIKVLEVWKMLKEGL